MAEVKTYRVDLPDGRFVNVQSDKELTEDQIRQVQEMAPSAEPQRGVLEGLLTGAATGVAPSAAFLKTLGTVGRATAGAGPMVSIPSSLLAGIAAAAATGIGQRKAIEAISPETAKRIEETAAQQPLATMIGSAVTSGFKPGPALAETQLGRFAERAVPAALGGGIQLGTEVMDGEGGQLPEGAATRIATAAGINALLNRETALAQRIIGPVRPPVRPPELPKVKPPTPVTDNLGQVKAGESLPSATAKANQMAKGGATAEVPATEQIKQQTAATEAQTRAAQKDAETAQAEAAKAQQAAVELEQKFNEQEDLVVELQRLTGKPRDAIVASIPEGEIDPRLDFLRSEVGYNTLVAELQGITGTSYGTITKLFPKGKGDSGLKALQQEIAYRRNPLVADADRRIKELEAQVGGIERRGARQREEAIATGEAQRAMEEAIGRALAPEIAIPSVLEAPEAAMGEIPGFMERPAMVTPERNVEVQIGEQNRFNREKRALEEKAIGIQEELSKKGVDILIEQARVLAALAKENPAEYNYTKQRIIDAVVPEVQGPPVRRPTRLTALEALTPEAVGIEAPAPAPAPVPAPTPVKPRAARRAPRAMAEAPAPVPEVILTERVTAPEAPAPAPVVAPEAPIPAISRVPEAPTVPAPTPEVQIPVKPTEKAIPEAPAAQPKKWKRVSDFWGKTIGEFRDESNAQRNNLPKNIANAWEDLTHLFNRSKAMQGKRVRAEQLGIDPTSESGRIALDKAQELGVIKGLGENRKQFTFDKVRYSNVGEVLPISIYPEYFKEPIKPVEPQATIPKPEVTPAPTKLEQAASVLTKEEQAINDKIEQTIEALDLARANLEPTSKIVSILKRSKLLTEGEIKLVQGAGKSMGPEDAATEAMSLLEFKKAEAKPVEAKAEVAAQTPDEVAAVKAIETGSIAPEAPAPTPAPATAGSLVPEAPPVPAPTTKANRLAQIKERFKQTNAGMTPRGTKAAVQEVAAEATLATPAEVPTAEPIPAERFSQTKAQVYDKSYSFYKKSSEQFSPWFAEIGGKEYPLTLKSGDPILSIGMAKAEAKRIAAKELRPSGGELGIRPSSRMPSPGEPLAGAAIGYITGDTEEDRIERAKKGFLIGGAISLGAQGLGRMTKGTVKMTPRGLQTLGAIDAHHGTWKSGIKEFSSEFIGKGEGAQAYGFGLYFAQLKNVAEDYVKKLSNQISSFRFKNNGTGEVINIVEPIGSKYNQSTVDNWLVASTYQNLLNQAAEKEIGGNVYKPSQLELLKTILKNPNSVSPDNKLKKIVENEIGVTAQFGPGAGMLYDKKEISNNIQKLRQKILNFGESVGWSKGEETLTPTGSLYEVTINAEPNEMLDWDVPLSKQSDTIKQAITKALVNSSEYIIYDSNNKVIGSDFNYYNALSKAKKIGGTIYKPSISELNDKSGEFIYKTLTTDFLKKLLPEKKLGEGWSPKTSQESKALSQAAESASALLDSLGIKGIKYKDQFSRTSKSKDELEIILGSELRQRESKYFNEKFIPNSRLDSKYFVVQKGEFLLDPGVLSPELQKLNERSGWNSIEEATKVLESIPDSTRNYVVFNDKNIKVLAENEQPITSTGFMSGIKMPSAGEPLAGAAIGYLTGDTEEDRKQNAILGFQLGSLVSLAGTAARGGKIGNLKNLNAIVEQRTSKPKPITEATLKETPIKSAPLMRDSFINQLLRSEKADSQSVYNKMVADNKINNTGVPSAQVAQDIAKAPVHHQKMLSDLASAFPMITKVPGGQAISDAIGSVAKGAEKYFGTAISNIASRSPRAAGAINTLFYEKAKQQLALWENGAQSLNDFTKTKLLKEKSDDFWRLARNGDVEGAKAILRTTEGGEQAVRNYDLVLEQRRLIREEAKANGIPMGDIGDALPSIVADVDGLLKYLGVEERGRYGKMLEAARKAKADRVIKAAEETGVEPPDRSTIALNSDEEVLVMSNYLTGIRNTTGKPGFLKGRSIETVDKEMDQFYAPGSVALKRYYDRWVDYKLNKQFFGKVRPDLTPNEPIGGNIAKILNEDYQSGGLDDDGLKRVQEAVRSLFHFDYKATNSLADKARKVQTFAMLSDISTAVIQFADLFTMAYAYGGPKGVINAFKPGKRVTLRDINLLENPNADIDDITKGIPKGGKIGRVVSAAYEAPLKYLLGGADKINKEGLLNSAKGFIADTVQSPETRRFKDLDSYYSKMYPERWPAMLEDLRKPEFREGKLTDNTAFFLRNELAKFQPIDLAGRAEGYAAAGPWGKTLYTLRSYAIKQLDIIRRDVYDNFKAANQTGEVKYAAKAIANMAAYAALVGAGQQLFRYGMDEALGRKIEDPKEYAIQGAMGIMLIPRYSIYRLGEQGLFVAAAEWAVPGSGILNDLQQDVKATGKYLAGQTDVRGLRTVPNIEAYFKNLEATKFLPVAGREIYWWAGKGAEKTKKLELEALMGKQRPSTLETIFRTFVPADLKTEMKP